MKSKAGVRRCHICDAEPVTHLSASEQALAAGKECPICYAPTCRQHMVMVRWRWKNGRGVGEERICKECRRTYRHRGWDTMNRDWIS